MIPTENINENTKNIDVSNTLEIVTMINNEDFNAVRAVQNALPQIAQGADIISANFLKGGRLLYFGAGTSGRLGVLDASECPPTFNTDPSMVQGVIAGGERAIRFAVEGAEDSFELAQKDFDELKISNRDTVVSISASGNAAYVVQILKSAKEVGAKTIAVTSNPEAKMKEFADCFICAKTGAEAVSGSTRMKAGTAQKMILNMLSTASMIKIGKTYENLMIDVRPTNTKLKNRAVSIVSMISGCTREKALEVLTENNFKVKHCVLIIKYAMNIEDAEELLVSHNGVLRKVFEKLG